MAKYTLYYFNAKGRAEPIRFAFDYAGIDFDNKMLSFDEFKAQKETFPFKQLPVLYLEDGTSIAESYAILQFVGSLTGTYPTDPLQAALVNQTLFCTEDMLLKLATIFYAADEQQKQKAFAENQIAMPKMLANLNNSIMKTGSNGYCVGDSITVADFQLHMICHFISLSKIVNTISKEDEIMKEFPAIIAVYDNVNSLPALQKRLKEGSPQ